MTHNSNLDYSYISLFQPLQTGPRTNLQASCSRADRSKTGSVLRCNDCFQLYKVYLDQLQLSTEHDENTMVCKNCNKYDFFINDDIVIDYINEYPEIWFFYNKDYNKFKFLLYKSQFYYNKKGGGVICVLAQYDTSNNFLLTFPIKNFIENIF